MSGRTIFLGKLIGFYLFFFALYMIIQPQAAISTLTDLIHSPALVLICALFGTTAGMAIVLTHNVWSGGALPIIVTITGWLALIKGLALLLLPPAAQVAYYAAFHFAQYFYVYDAVLFVLGIFLLIAAFRAPKIDSSPLQH